MEDSITEFNVEETGQQSFINGVGNKLVINEDQILKNLQIIQGENKINLYKLLDSMHFLVEMETDTGKIAITTISSCN